jgi:Domain of unknown function (DUF222)
MKTEEVQRLVERVAAVAADCADWGALKPAVDDLRRLKSWVDGREVMFARLTAATSCFPEKSLAEAGQTSLHQAEKVIRRAGTVELVPALGESLDAGRLSAGHVDAFTRALREVEPGVRSRLVGAAPGLVMLGEQSTSDEFAKIVRAEGRRLESETDGLDRLERQRRAVRLNSWKDRETGMWRWSITWDPETASMLERRLDAQVEALFHDRQPEGCPTDPIEKQAFLRAHALLAWLQGDGPKTGRPEIIVVVDHTDPQPDGRPSADWGIDVDLPQQVLDDLYETADISTVVVRNGVVIDAPGELNLGRKTRLANRAQRRALRGLYSTCAIPGCCVRYSRTKLHHVIWWRHGGLTDLENLLPLCELHHQKVHNHGWILDLGAQRELTITLPDGQIMATGPPKRSAA